MKASGVKPTEGEEVALTRGMAGVVYYHWIIGVCTSYEDTNATSAESARWPK